jgi:hypothetical protein
MSVRGSGARATSSRSITQRVPMSGARVQARKANVTVRAATESIRQQAGRRGAYRRDPRSISSRIGPQNPFIPKTCTLFLASES